jgi:SAM-dependent MidA family methyltransferase
MSLPPPEALACAHSQQLQELIRERIATAGGWLSFAAYMDLALYAPGLGYYAAGARKFGSAGDFVTAPEMTPLFGYALARQVAQLMKASAPAVIEVGAGSGRLATDLLRALAELDCLPERYAILDVSPDLHERQRETLAREVPELLPRVVWLERLPEHFSGVVLANELLDAMPAHCVAWHQDGIYERGIACGQDGRLIWLERPATGPVLAAAREIAEQCTLPPGLVSEIGLAASAWTASWGPIIERGALLLIDYGFPRHEFYHSQRSGGTLMCHYRHLAHTDPFFWPGLQDITAHVDFTAAIAAAFPHGLELLGYTSQGQFLLNCGMLECLGDGPTDSPAYIRAAAAANRLILPHEMGELFKVIAMGKDIDVPLIGFGRGDRSHTL